MDPLSAVAGLVSIAAVGATLSKQLYELTESIQQAPEEIQTISRDTRAFYSIIFSLEASLKDSRIAVTIADDTDLMDLVERLEPPLRNCTAVFGQLMVQMQALLKSSRGEWYKMSSSYMKWYFRKKGIRELQQKVEASKQTLDLGLSAIGALCNFRILAAGLHSPGKPMRRGSNDTDAGFALRRYVEITSTCSDPSVPSSPLFSTRDPSSSPALVMRDELQLTNLTLDGSRLHAAAAGSTDIIRSLLNLGAYVDITEFPPDHTELLGRNTPLHYAAKAGYEGTVRLLIDNGADVCAIDSEGYTPLEEAARFSCINIIGDLIDKGAPINALGSHGKSPLHLAAVADHSRTITALLDNHADIQVRDHEGSSPLHLAARYGGAETLSTLLKCNADSDARNDFGFSPLYYATEERNAATISVLLDHHAFKAACISHNVFLGTTRPSPNATPIFLSVWFDQANSIIELIKHGAKVDFTINYDGRTPLLLAAVEEHLLILKQMTQNGVFLHLQGRALNEAPADARTYRDRAGDEEALLHFQETMRRQARDYLKRIERTVIDELRERKNQVINGDRDTIRQKPMKPSALVTRNPQVVNLLSTIPSSSETSEHAHAIQEVDTEAIAAWIDEIGVAF
ncbi:MAG: hypothetical protein Q9219_003007 [cf. Caloplaca sp. 3 TL-2023]